MTTLAAAAAPDPTGSLGRDFATGRAWSENTHSLALLLGLDGTIVDLNQQMADTLGQPIEELKGTLLWHQPAFASGAEWQGPFQKVLEARNALRLDTEYGGRWYDTSFTPCLDSSGKAIGVSIVGWDITERKQAETALRESEERHRSQIENLVNGFAYCRMDYLDGRPHDFTYLKPEFHAAFTHYRRRNALQLSFRPVFTGLQHYTDPPFTIHSESRCSV